MSDTAGRPISAAEVYSCAMYSSEEEVSESEDNEAVNSFYCNLLIILIWMARLRLSFNETSRVLIEALLLRFDGAR